MRFFSLLFCILLFSSDVLTAQVDKTLVQTTRHALTINVTFDKALDKQLKPDGRLLLFISSRPGYEPRYNTWPSPGNYLMGKNFTGIKAGQKLVLDNTSDWMASDTWRLDNMPAGTYYMQLVWDHDREESRPEAPGNLYSEPFQVDLNENKSVDVSIAQVIEPRKLIEHDLVKMVDMESRLLSDFWSKPMRLKATVLLPHNYEKGKAYPIRYNVSGYGGRYTRINRVVGNAKFMKWWTSDEAPRVINVFLDGEGPFGDSYQMDSDNSGPYGESLIKELIPHIEKEYRGTTSAKTRFVDGCSTGGWVSLGLQIYYPDEFNGAFSYSPDAIEFSNYQLINIYKDDNAFTNEYGYLRPIARETNGEPMLSFQQFVHYENILAPTNTYLTSGGQIGSHTALYSPKGKDGLPKPLIDPLTGNIDREVAKAWEKYDFKKYLQKNWTTLGPKLQGKIYIWMGDMDHFYLNIATRAFEEYLQTTQNPKSDAVIEFAPTQGHCTAFSNRRILEQIQERLDKM